MLQPSLEENYVIHIASHFDPSLYLLVEHFCSIHIGLISSEYSVRDIDIIDVLKT